MTRQHTKVSFVPLENLTNRAKKSAKNSIKRCTRCLMVETNETITFDTQGVCNICQSFKQRDQWNLEKKEEEFLKIIEPYRGKYAYDAIVPFSGGKDSSWVAYVLTKKYGLKILLATYDSNFRRPLHLRNIDRLIRSLGCDQVTFRSNNDVIRKAMLETLKRKGDFCWFCHTGVCSFPMKTAIMYKVPLIIWGEPNSEYAAYMRYEVEARRIGEETVGTEKAFNRIMNLGINAKDMLGFLEGIEERDLEPFRFPEPHEFKELMQHDFRNICLGDYYKWDPIRQIKILEEELGWTSTEVEGLHPMYSGEKVECFLQGVRDYLRYIKRGYSRTNQRSNAEIRRGALTREEALEQEKYDARKPASLPIILEYLGITEEEFNQIALSHTISPWAYNADSVEQGPPLPDHDLWVETLLPKKTTIPTEKASQIPLTESEKITEPG
jgi:N-acetyl sugar amidotransferase